MKVCQHLEHNARVFDPDAIIRSYHLTTRRYYNLLKNEIVESNIRWVAFKWWKSATREYDICKQTYFVCWINVKMLSQIKLLLLPLIIRFYNGILEKHVVSNVNN